MRHNANYIDSRKVYYYPKYVPNQQIIKGLFFTEWMLVVAPVAIGLFIKQMLGFIIGLVIGSGIWFIFYRKPDERTNLAHQITSVFNYYTSQQQFKKKARSEIKGDISLDLEPAKTQAREEQLEEESSKKHKKKKGTGKNKKDKRENKKNKKKQEKNMEDLFPFRSIGEGIIEMENGVIYCYFRIQANNLDLLSEYDLNKIIKTFSKNVDSNKYDISFFIQDSIFKVGNNIEEIEKCKTKSKVPFLRLLLDQTKDMIIEEKDDVNKKINFLRIRIPAEKGKTLSIEDLQGRVVKNFKDSLNPLVATREELKQMLAIYGNRIFSEQLPDTELKVEVKEEKSLLRRKKKEYKDTQLPGIYNFKNLIVPINTSFKPSFAKLGRNIVKTYAISSFLGSTSETNLLAKVSALKGVTTMIYLNDLKLSKFRSNAALQVKASNSSKNDNFDEIDADAEKESLEGTYKRARSDHQKMYYLSIYFQITAKTKKEFKDLEEQFLQEIDDVNITLDDLETEQKDGYLSVSPIGNDRLSEYTKQNVPSESFANLYPFNEPALLDPTGLPLGNIVDSKLMVLFDPFTYRGSNYNMLLLGLSGIGKTVLLMLILQICACKNYFIRNIDFEGTYLKFFEKIGGVNVDVSGGNEFCINPLQVRIPDKVKMSIIDDYISEVVKFISIYKPEWTQDDLDLFQDCLKKTYTRFQITNEIEDITKLKPQDFPILSDVVETIKSERKRSSTAEDSIAHDSMYQKLLRGLTAAVDGADACMFNRHTNLGSVDINDIASINFDMSQIMSSNTGRKLAQLVNVFTFISQFVNANMRGDKRIVVSADELDKCLSMEYLPVIEIFNDYERRFRKRLASFIKATQTVDELDTKVAELEAKIKPLFSQPSIKFLFHLGDINYEKPQKLLDLTDTEINRLKDNRNGQCLMKVNKAIYDLDVMMPLWFESVKTDVKKEPMKQHG